MKVLQFDLQHCEAAQDLFSQTVRELKADLAILAEPYRHLDTQPWVSGQSGKAAIWSCGQFPFQELISRTDRGFVRPRVRGIHYYSCYAPPSWTIGEFEDFLDRLGRDAKDRFSVALTGDFNAWTGAAKGRTGRDNPYSRPCPHWKWSCSMRAVSPPLSGERPHPSWTLPLWAAVSCEETAPRGRSPMSTLILTTRPLCGR